MGTAASRASEIGVGVNPRLQYADYRSSNQNKDLVIDAPVLVKLDNGTIRYRYTEDEQIRHDKNKRREVNHEGDERAKKKGYFFHTSLNRFGADAEKEKEEDFKFCYVYKGAAKAKQKKVYYVFGKGLKTNEHGFVEPRKFDSKEAYKGPTAYKVHGHVYYDLIFLQQDAEVESGVTIEEDIDSAGEQSITMIVNEMDPLEKVFRTVAVKLIKPISHIHLFFYGNELSLGSKIGSLRQPPDGAWKRFRILLKPK